MQKNRLFVPEAALEVWLTDGAAEMQGQDLLLHSEQRRYRLAEGVRVVQEVSGEPDANELVGRCKTRAFLKELGAEIMEGSMVLDNNAYDVVPGFIGTPIGAIAASDAPSALSSDEQLLAEFLARKM
jgi:hypothetical protein